MAHAHTATAPGPMPFVERLNGPWHERAMQAFMVIVLAHWAEHLLQTLQIYVFGWPVPEARGAIGYFFPWVIKSEVLHYGYAVVMLAGLWVLLQRGVHLPIEVVQQAGQAPVVGVFAILGGVGAHAGLHRQHVPDQAVVLHKFGHNRVCGLTLHGC